MKKGGWERKERKTEKKKGYRRRRVQRVVREKVERGKRMMNRDVQRERKSAMRQ